MILKAKKFFVSATLLLVVAGFLCAFFITRNSTRDQSKQPLPSAPSVMAEKTSSSASAELSQPSQQFLVTRVIDGDTIEIEGGQKIRYIGIDTPETVDSRKLVGCFGLESSQKNKELVEGKTVRLEKDVSETDKYGRLLRYVYLSSENAGSDQIFVNDYLVRQGFAHASTYPPDVKYRDQFASAQQEAMSKNMGLWSVCQNLSSTQNQTQAQSGGCLIKGNISSSGEKIYHVPGQRYYDKTVIDESKGERLFCTEDEAQKAGWRKSKI
jgi:micrococcal nuclease